MAGEGKHLGIYGFGAAGHIIAQVARWQGRSVYAFTRDGDVEAQRLAISLGADWAGGSEDAAAGAARRRDHLRAGRRAGAAGAARGAQRRARGLRRHSHVGYSFVSLPYPLGGAAARSRSPTSRATTESNSSRSRRKRASRRIRRPFRCGRRTRSCRSCAPGRSPAPRCCGHDDDPPARAARPRLDQERGARFSRRSASAGKGGKRIDTHASMVFLGDDRVLEDQARRSPALPRLFDAGEAQARLRGGTEGQRRQRARSSTGASFAITRGNDGVLEIGGTGTPVEWAVEMARFDEEQTLDRIAGTRIDRTGLAADACGRDPAIARQGAARRRRNAGLPPSLDHRPQHREIPDRARTSRPRPSISSMPLSHDCLTRRSSLARNSAPGKVSCGAATAIFISPTLRW